MEKKQISFCTELSKHELVLIQGGFWQYVAGGAIALLAMGIHDTIDHPEAFVDGFLGNLN